MPVVLVIIIVAAWAVILGPSVVKRHARSGGDQSISHFHQQLRILEQRAPDPIVAPAYRLRAVDGGGIPSTVHYPDSGTRPVLTVVGAKELPRPALAFLGDPVPGDPASGADAAGAPGVGSADPAPRVARDDLVRDDRFRDDRYRADGFADDRYRADGFADDRYRADGFADDRLDDDRFAQDRAHGDRADLDSVFVGGTATRRGPRPMARARARRRRRDTLAVLSGVLAVTVLAGVVTGSTAAWAMATIDALALAAFVGLLVHLRRRASERERKLHYLDPLAARPARPGGPPSAMSARDAHPSGREAAVR